MVHVPEAVLNQAPSSENYTRNTFCGFHGNRLVNKYMDISEGSACCVGAHIWCISLRWTAVMLFYASLDGASPCGWVPRQNGRLISHSRCENRETCVIPHTSFDHPSHTNTNLLDGLPSPSLLSITFLFPPR